MSPQRRDAVVVFAKLPTPGQVKTRLAAVVGSEAAALFYRHSAERVIAALGRLTNVAVYCFFAQGEEQAAVAEWLAPLGMVGMVLMPQLQALCLGARIDHAMRHAFSCGHQRVAIVGTDVPDLCSATVGAALQGLDSHQAVLGPAEDGGYYLLALSCLPDGLFEGIEWSTATVLSAQVAAAQRLGLSVAPLDTLPRLPDIDTLADLQQWCSRHQHRQASIGGSSSSSSNGEDSLLAIALHVVAAAAQQPMAARGVPPPHRPPL